MFSCSRERRGFSKPEAVLKPLKGSETIMLVEDEEAILKMTELMFQSMGYTVISSSKPKDAVKIVAEPMQEKIHLLITDVVMPEMNGKELTRKILERHPFIRCPVV